MVVTNDMLLKFYSDIGIYEDSWNITWTYFEHLKKTDRLRRGNGDYIDVAATFLSEGKEGKFKEFYEWFIKQKPGKMLSLKYLPKSDELKMLTIAPANAAEAALLEKWHLLVSFYAMEEYWGAEKIEDFRPKWLTDKIYEDARHRSGILNRTGCRELLLWMYEAAVVKTGSNDLYLVRDEIEKGTIDSDNIWKEVSGGRPSCLREKIYGLIEKYYESHHDQKE